MKQAQLNRVLKLVKRTGDRFVVLDQETDNVLVVMNVDEYEDLLNQTIPPEELDEEDMLDKIDCDIKSWQKKRSANQEELQNFLEDDEDLDEESLPDNFSTENSFDEKESEELPAEFDNKNTAEEESLEDVPHEDEEKYEEGEGGEEPKFYLEPVE
jgi:exoribonuclease R